MYRSQLIYSQDITSCNQLFRLNAFRSLIKFLLGVDPEQVEEVDEMTYSAEEVAKANLFEQLNF